MATDLPSSSATFAIPLFVIQGGEDISTPTTAAMAYFESVSELSLWLAASTARLHRLACREARVPAKVGWPSRLGAWRG